MKFNHFSPFVFAEVYVPLQVLCCVGIKLIDNRWWQTLLANSVVGLGVGGALLFLVVMTTPKEDLPDDFR